MGKKTNISWADATWNPWMGCHKVSEGCAHCYGERDALRWGRDFSLVQRVSQKTFQAPLRWSKRVIFVCSHSDFFLEEADGVLRDEAWDVISLASWHTYKILTKRPERILGHLPPDWPYPHVQLGVTIELQRYIERIQHLQGAGAYMNFVSCEPCLGPIDLKDWLLPRCTVCGEVMIDRDEGWRWLAPGWEHKCPQIHGQAGHMPATPGLNQVIVGGESGPDYREMDLDWARFLRDQCRASKVPFIYKQRSALYPGTDPYLDGVKWEQPAQFFF